MTDPQTRRAMARAIHNLKAQQPIVVHGGGPVIKAALDHAKLEHRFVDGLRVTTAASLPVIEQALTILNKKLAQEIGDAVGLTGRDASVVQASLKDEQLGFVGSVCKVNTSLIELLIKHNLIPVLACIAANEKADGVLNVNADEVAGSVAGALKIASIFLSNVAGVHDDPNDPKTLQTELHRADILERINDGRISGGMIPKVMAALEALNKGATYAVIADGRNPELLSQAITGKIGTRVYP